MIFFARSAVGGSLVSRKWSESRLISAGFLSGGTSKPATSWAITSAMGVDGLLLLNSWSREILNAPETAWRWDSFHSRNPLSSFDNKDGSIPDASARSFWLMRCRSMRRKILETRLSIELIIT